MEDFSGKIPVVLDGGASDVGVESTVVSVFDEKCVILRPGRNNKRNAFGGLRNRGGFLGGVKRT